MNRFIYQKVILYFEEHPHAHFWATAREINDILDLSRDDYHKICYYILQLRYHGIVESKLKEDSTVLVYRRKV